MRRAPFSARITALAAAFALLLTTCPIPAQATAYDGHPKLIVLIVIDQFRGDYLERYRADFKGNGFKLFLDKGANFTDCYYDYANTTTAPGHSTIGTGAYTDGHGIATNEWWDLSRNVKREVSSVEDSRYAVVGDAKGAEGGASPRNLLASTLGDELRLATHGQSQVYSVSLKDRAAILSAGASANGAFWINPVSGRFITSSFYMTALPQWAQQFNASDEISAAAQAGGVDNLTNFYEQVAISPAANDYQLDFARALIQGEQLGKHSTPDMLIISLSANDIEGHRYGPDSPQEREMVDGLDTSLDGFFSWLDKYLDGGLANTWVALTADHGVAPTPATAAALGLPAANINMKALTAALNAAMNDKFSPGEKINYLLPSQSLPYLQLDSRTFDRAGINEQDAEEAVRDGLAGALSKLAAQASGAAVGSSSSTAKPTDTATQSAETAAKTSATPRDNSEATSAPTGQTSKLTSPTTGPGTSSASASAMPPLQRWPAPPTLVASYTRVALAKGDFLASTEMGRLLAHSYSRNGGWWVMAVFEAFQMDGSNPNHTTHFSPWSYDRHVPLAFYGAPFVHGTYHGRVAPVDLAATMASLLDINQPSASIGQVLTQALHAAVYPSAATPLRRRGAHPAKSPAATAPTPDTTSTPATKPANPPAANSPPSTTPAPSRSQTPPAANP
jgi:predicted AlkP superfamily pyrophosphatase or phosphodiesterase